MNITPSGKWPPTLFLEVLGPFFIRIMVFMSSISDSVRAVLRRKVRIISKQADVSNARLFLLRTHNESRRIS